MAVCEVKQEKVAGPFCPHRGLRGVVRGVVTGAMATWGGSTAVLGSEAQPRGSGRWQIHSLRRQGRPGSWAWPLLAESQELSFYVTLSVLWPRVLCPR